MNLEGIFCALQDAHGNEVSSLKAIIADHEENANKIAAMKAEYEDELTKLRHEKDETLCNLNSKLEQAANDNDLLRSEKSDCEKEIGQLRTDLEELKLKSDNVSQEDAVNEEEVRRKLKEELEEEQKKREEGIKEDYEEQIEDLKYEHEREQTRLRKEIEIEFQDDMRKC